MCVSRLNIDKFLGFIIIKLEFVLIKGGGSMKGTEDVFEVRKIKQADSSDKRGPTYEWRFPNGEAITFIVRKKGTKFGKHFHPGRDPSKNPEKLFLVCGEVEVSYSALSEQDNPKKLILEAGDQFTIYPRVIHSFVALTDVVIAEKRETYFNPLLPDTVPA